MDENAIAKLAGRQHGVVTAGQLHRAGFDNAAIKRRCRAGRLHRLHRGVYLVGHAAAPAGAAEMAAVLACGPGTVISHRSAAHLWRLPGFLEPAAPIDVTIAGREPGRRPGIRIRGSGTLRPRDVRRVHGIPITAPGRTLLDLAAAHSLRECQAEPRSAAHSLRECQAELRSAAHSLGDLEAAFVDARARRLISDRDLKEVLEQSRGRRGASVFRRLAALDRGHGLTRSEAERRMLALVRAAALPMPRANARVEGFEADLLWKDQKVIIEVDGYAFHRGGRAFERDRERDATLTSRGYVVLRVTWRQLIAQPEAVIARLAAAISLRG